MATVLAFCPECGTKVSAHTLVNDNDLLALDSGAEVRIGHVAVNSADVSRSEDHIWILGDTEKENLRRWLASGAA
jgi:hypothetical protein